MTIRRTTINIKNKRLDFIRHFLATAKSKQALFCSFGLTKTFLFLIPLFLLALPARGQDVSWSPSYETRIYAAVEKSFLKDESLSVEFSPEVRFNDLFDYDKTLLKLGVKYKLFNWFNIGLGGRVIFNQTNSRGTEIKGRFDFDISKNIKLGRFGNFRLKPRIRLCDYEEFYNSNDDPKSLQLRYKLGFSYRYKRRAVFEPEISAEAFQNLSSGKISSVRYSIGGDFRITKHHFIGVAYMLETQFKDRVIQNIFETGYTYKF